MSTAITGRVESSSQPLLLTASAYDHMARHRQLTPWSTEAGGQLFGTIDDNLVTITEASGPYLGDERSRYRYRSNPTAAQRAIENRSKRGLLYLGEWHTHAEDVPDASGLDHDAMRRLIQSSQLNSSALLMVIVGRKRTVQGLAAWSVTRGSTHQWMLSAEPGHLK